MQPGELRRGVETIGSLASEGALIADGVARNRTRSTFTRVQARMLGADAMHEAEKLADASAGPGLAGDKATAVRLAQDAADALGELQVAPGDERGAASIRATLTRLSDRAGRLASEL